MGSEGRTPGGCDQLVIGAWASEGGIWDEEGSGAEVEWFRLGGRRGHIGREKMWAGAGCLWERAWARCVKG